MWVGQLSWWSIGPFLLTQCQLQSLQFLVHLIDLLSILLRCNGFSGIQKAIVDRTGSRPPNSDHNLFLVQVWLWEVLCSLFTVQLCHQLSYKIHFLLYIIIWLRNGSSLLCRIREDTSKWWFFRKFLVSLYGTYFLSFLTFSLCFKCQTMTEWSMLSSLATFHIAVRGSASMIFSLDCSQFPMAHHCALHLQGSCLPCKTSQTTAALYIR